MNLFLKDVAARTFCSTWGARRCGAWIAQDSGAVVPPEAACIAVAGPVSQNKVTMTNRNWVVDGAEVR